MADVCSNEEQPPLDDDQQRLLIDAKELILTAGNGGDWQTLKALLRHGNRETAIMALSALFLNGRFKEIKKGVNTRIDEINMKFGKSGTEAQIRENEEIIRRAFDACAEGSKFGIISKAIIRFERPAAILRLECATELVDYGRRLIKNVK
jgi:hypothetical protein